MSNRKFDNADEWNKKEEERLKKAAEQAKREEALDSVFHKADSIGEPETAEEQLERLEWELAVAQQNYLAYIINEYIFSNLHDNRTRFEFILNQGIAQYAKALKGLADYDSGVAIVDQTPGLELDNYNNKHGQ